MRGTPQHGDGVGVEAADRQVCRRRNPVTLLIDSTSARSSTSRAGEARDVDVVAPAGVRRFSLEGGD